MKRLLIGLVALLVVGGGLLVAGGRWPGAAPPPSTPVGPVRGAGAITAEGKVVPVREVRLALTTGGAIAEVLVEEGQSVEPGAVLVRLEGARAAAGVDQARAGLRRAQAQLANLTAAPRAEDVAAAQAAVDAANAQLAKLEAGARPETVAQAQANLAAARAELDFLRGGGRPEAVAVARSGLDQARARLAALETGRPEAIAQAKAGLDAAQARLDALKAGPTAQQVAVAERAVEQARAAAYGADVNKDGACNPVNPRFLCDAATAQAVAAHTGVEQARDQLKVLTSKPTAPQLQEAQAAVDAARAQLEQAQRPGSESDLAAARQTVDGAVAQVGLAERPSSSADLARARAAAEVAAQELRLAEQPYTAQDLDAARAAVRQASAQLAVVNAPARAEAIAAAEADVAAARASLDQATAALADLELRAPFAGVVADLDAGPGEFVQPGAAVASVADTSAWEVTATDLTELSVTRVRPGQAATLTFEAIPGLELPARVDRVKKLGTEARGDVLYAVTLRPDRTDDRLLWNMTAAVRVEP